VKLTHVTVSLAVMLVMSPLCTAQNSRMLPPQMRHAQELQAQNESMDSRPVDTQALGREADELATLAASVRPDVHNLTRGVLAKDLAQKLKQIEKLSKHLRSELAR
jgi:hypothetical protein